MTSKALPLTVMPYSDGLNNTLPALYLRPDQLTVADNVLYGLQGERRKRLGTSRMNASTIAGGANITAFADFQRHGASLTPTQQIVVTANGNAYFSTGGNFTLIGAFGSNTSLITNIGIAQGFAVFSDGSSIPKKYDQAAFTDLDGGTATAPRFTAASYHLRRLFAVGTAASPSRVDVSAGGDITLWTGGDTVQLQLDEDDGDINVGISKTFHKRVYVFKGPTKGSIHELSGNTLASLTRDVVFNGLPLLNHKAVITTDNDIYWLSRFGAHSLRTTVQYGDLQSAFLSLPINSMFTEGELSLTQLNGAWGFWHPLYNIIGWFVTPSGATSNTMALVYHYLISDPMPNGKKFWSIWKFSGLSGFAGGNALTPNTNVPRLYIGGTGDGFVYQGDQSTLTDGNGSAYTTRIKTGINLDMGQAGGPLQEKQFYCTVDSMRVLTSDLRWIPSGDLMVGDQLLGFDDYPRQERGWNARKTSPSTILSIKSIQRPVYRLILSDGTELSCSAEHPWLANHSGSRGFKWTIAQDLALDIQQGLKRGLSRFFTPWKPIQTWESGYLSAALDGEGHISIRQGAAQQSLTMGIAQKKNPMLDRIEELLHHFSIPYSIRPNTQAPHIYNIQINGKWSDRLAILGSIRPVRLVEKLAQYIQSGQFRMGCYAKAWPLITKVEYEGPKEVIALETSSSTYFCEGFGAHNSVTTFYEPVGTFSHDLNIIVDNRTLSTSITMAGLGDVLA